MRDVFGPAELVMQRSAHHLQNDAAAMCTHDDMLPAGDLFFSALGEAAGEVGGEAVPRAVRQPGSSLQSKCQGDASLFVQGFAFAPSIGGVTSGRFWGEVLWWKIVLILLRLSSLLGALNVLRVRILQRKRDVDIFRGRRL